MTRLARALMGALSIAVLPAAAVHAQSVNCDGVAQWTASRVFNPGDRTVFEGSLYESRAIIHTVPPTTWVPNGWGVLLGACGGTTG